MNFKVDNEQWFITEEGLTLKEVQDTKNKIREVLETKAKCLDLIGFSLDGVAYENILMRNDSFAEEPYRVMFTLSNLNFKVVSKSKLKFEEIRGVNTINLEFFIDKPFVTIGEIKEQMEKVGISFSISEDLKFRNLSESSVFLHSTKDKFRVEFLFIETKPYTEIDEIKYNIKGILENYYIVPNLRKFDYIHNFENNYKFKTNKYILNMEEILDNLNNN